MRCCRRGPSDNDLSFFDARRMPRQRHGFLMTTPTHFPPPIAPLDEVLRKRLQHVIDHKTKPPGSLGQLEAIALQIGLIQHTERPVVQRPVMIVFAGDHGIAAEGVSPYPQAVTAQMVANFLAGGAAINAFSGVAQSTLEIVDASVGGLLRHDPGRDDPGLAFALARLTWETAGGVPLGVFRSVSRPVYEDLVHEQVRTSIERKGEGDLRALLHGSDTWTIG